MNTDEKLDQVLHELHELRVLVLGIGRVTGVYLPAAKREQIRDEMFYANMGDPGPDYRAWLVPLQHVRPDSESAEPY